VYVNKNYVGCFSVSAEYNGYEILRKDGDLISNHVTTSTRCYSYNRTQEFFDTFSCLEPYTRTLECYELKDGKNPGDKVCARVEFGEITHYYTYNALNYLTHINYRGVDKEISYEYSAPASKFVIPSGSAFTGCDAIAYTQPTEGFCPVSEPTNSSEKIHENEDEWEIHIEFENLDLDASFLSAEDVLGAIHAMTGINVSEMRMETDTDEQGKVLGVTIYITDEASTDDLLNVVNGCKSDNSQCQGILKYVKSASVTKKAAFKEGSDSIHGMKSAVAAIMIAITLFFSH